MSKVCLYTSLNLQGSMHLWTWELAPDCKSSIFPLLNLNNFNLKTARNNTGNSGPFFSSLKQQLWSSISVFWKEKAAFHFLLGSHLRVQFHLSKAATFMAVSIHGTLSPDLFSHGMVEQVLGVSLHSFATSGKHIFVNLWIEAWWH